jgi:hypothetical protein
MTTPPSDPGDPVPPIIAIGPPGTLFVSVDGSVRDALAHLATHPASGSGPRTTPVTPPPLPTGLALYDRRGRVLRITGSGTGATLEVSDPTDRRGELCALIEEQLAHLRARAYRHPERLEDEAHPADLRPPEPPRTPIPGSMEPPLDDRAYDAFFDELVDVLPYEAGPADHPGSWWHNLMHRLA